VPGPEPAARRRRDPRAPQARERLLDAAADLVAEQGWRAATTRAVAERAGMPAGLVHHHFSGVQDLVRRAALRTLARATDTPLHALLTADTLADGLPAAADAARLRPATAATLVELLAQALHDPPLRDDLAAATSAAVDALARHVGRPADAALLVALLDGLALHAALGLDTAGDDALRRLGALLDAAERGTPRSGRAQRRRVTAPPGRGRPSGPVGAAGHDAARAEEDDGT
jgi:AcrR family transcriptional regulator